MARPQDWLTWSAPVAVSVGGCEGTAREGARHEGDRPAPGRGATGCPGPGRGGDAGRRRAGRAGVGACQFGQSVGLALHPRRAAPVPPCGAGGRPQTEVPGPGGDLAGTVQRAGSAVTAFKPGDEVYGIGHGAFAGYIAIRQDGLAPKPGKLTFEQAAAVPLAAVTALQGLSAGGIQPGQNVLIS